MINYYIVPRINLPGIKRFFKRVSGPPGKRGKRGKKGDTGEPGPAVSDRFL